MKTLTLLALALSLLACETSESSMVRPALTREELLDPTSCKDCHPKHYEQWSGSMHAYAAEDPVFLAMNKRGQEETSGALGDFCVNCHAPMAIKEGKLTDFANLDTLPQELKGVTCYYCHNTDGVGAEHFNNSLTLANDNVMRGAIQNPIEPSVHKVAFSSFHNSRSPDSAQMCGSCHDIKNPLGVRLERTYEEWSGSFFSDVNGFSFQTCNSCHMARLPGGRRQVAEETGRPGELTLAHDFHDHMWPAVDVALTDFPHAQAQRSAVESCFLPARALSGYLTIEHGPPPLGAITVQTETQAGHQFPSGAAQDRRLWIELIAYDENNTELYRIGQIGDQEIEESTAPHPCMFREYLTDENEEPTHDFWEAAAIPKSKLMPVGTVPGVTHTAICSDFRPPIALAAIDPAFIDIRMRLRPMGMDVLTDLVSTGHLAADIPAKMPTFTVASRRATFDPVQRRYAVSPSNDETAREDCHSYFCMMDPQGPDCLMQP